MRILRAGIKDSINKDSLYMILIFIYLFYFSLFIYPLKDLLYSH